MVDEKLVKNCKKNGNNLGVLNEVCKHCK